MGGPSVLQKQLEGKQARDIAIFGMVQSVPQEGHQGPKGQCA